MLTRTANGDSRLSFWLRVREFAVPPSMIETATARRAVGDWAGACAAANFDVDLDLRTVARTHGRELVSRLRADLRTLTPDLLRWHMPRIAPDGLLRPGLTVSLVRYGTVGRRSPEPVHLVARTPPAWADAGQRISLALWDGSHDEPAALRHPHPHPNRRFRLDLHRHLWDADRVGEIRDRAGSGGSREPGGGRVAAAGPAPDGDLVTYGGPALDGDLVADGRRCAVDRWADEARILLHAEGRTHGTVSVRLAAGQRLALEVTEDRGGGTPPPPRAAPVPYALPVLPDAATWTLPDLELLRSGALRAGQLHPLVASALVPDHAPTAPPPAPYAAGEPRIVECRGAPHRIGLVDGVLAPLDHHPDELRREELLVALTGTPLPCLRAIDEAHRRPDCLTGVRERLDHGDVAGALAVVEGLLGPEAALRDGPLRDELEAAARRRVTYGLYRAGLIGPAPERLFPGRNRPRNRRAHPRHTYAR
ncbi:hypothetical protein [Streptomyces sp. NPDC050504]|uniref:hypothetical protein n=1 Tax=Streptomyces sp. NPDC050504 TaxID=3365618 RepID=UPI0037B044E2